MRRPALETSPSRAGHKPPLNRVYTDLVDARDVPYAFVEDIAASWEHYGRFAAAFEEAVPEGLLLHAAGPTEEGFRIIGVWESEAAWDRFRSDRLGLEAETAGEGRPTFRALRPLHVVRGSGVTGVGAAGGTAPTPAPGSA